MPSNAGYYEAAYVLAALIYVGYGLALLSRRRKLLARLDARPRGRDGERP